MAIDTSHAAAKQYDRTFSVELLSEEEPATVLVAALSDFLDAVDRATEWLEREDPARTKKPSLAIFATTGGFREQVWAYPPESVGSDTAGPKRLVELFGFDPVTWNPQGGGANLVSTRPREHEPSPPNEHRPAGLVASAEPDSPPTSQPVGMRLTTAYMRRLREEVGEAWNDRPSRCCLILGSIFLWLTATLLEPAFLVSALAAASGLWTRRGHRAAAVPDDVDDWF
jgi:hypothetical protein